MKNAIKFLIFGMMLVSTFALTSFAQTSPEDCAAIYEKYKVERKGPDFPKYRAAMATGNDYLAKCKDVDQTITDYITKDIPKLEVKAIADQQQKEIYGPFNDGIKAKDWSRVYGVAPKVIGLLPDDLDVPLVMASIGYDLALAKNDAFNNDAINYAKMSLQKMEQGKTSASGDWGAGFGTAELTWIYKTKECTDGKVNATGWMNYTIGYIMFNRQNQKKNALPYLYKATQAGCETVKNSDIFRAIGSWYVEEFSRIETDKNATYDKLQAAAKEVPVDQAKVDGLKKQYEDLVALQKGYMERVIDTYARAHKIASPNPKITVEYKNNLLKRAKEFYGFRFTDASGYDNWVSKALATPFVDPTTPVIPVVEAIPTTTTAPKTNTVSNDTTTTSNDTRPRTATTTTNAKSGTAPTTAATTTPAATTKKAPAKKPTPKKKGTR